MSHPEPTVPRENDPQYTPDETGALLSNQIDATLGFPLNATTCRTRLLPFGYWRVMPRTVRAAPLTTSPSVTPWLTAPAPVMIFGSFTPSPLQSKPPLSITVVPLPTRVLAPVVASKISPMSPALRCRAFPTKTFPHANLANTPPLAEPVMTLERKVLFSINKVGKSGLPENRMP